MKLRSPWLVPFGLMLLSLIPMLAGVVRLVGLASNAPVTPDNSRFHDMPWPVVVHIVGATLFCGLGALQFHTVLRQTRPAWHRWLGRLLLPAGLAAAVSGLWMAYFYPLRPALEGDLLLAARTVAGTLMVVFLMLAWLRITQRNVGAHRAWVIRGYALGLGAGTQSLIGLPVTLLWGTPPQEVWEVLMTLSWVINALVAEWAIGSGRRWLRPSNPRLPAASAVGNAPQGQ